MPGAALSTVDNSKVIKTPGTRNLVEERDLLNNRKRDSNTLYERYEPRAVGIQRKEGASFFLVQGKALPRDNIGIGP